MRSISRRCGELAHPGIFLRLLAVSLIVAGEWLNGYLQTLVIKTTLGGSLSDAGFMASGVALMEIPFMLAWAAGLRRLGAVNTILAGAALYGGYLILMGSATAVWQIHALIPLAGAGAAALLSVPLSYFQDLFPAVRASDLAVADRGLHRHRRLGGDLRRRHPCHDLSGHGLHRRGRHGGGSAHACPGGAPGAEGIARARLEPEPGKV